MKKSFSFLLTTVIFTTTSLNAFAKDLSVTEIINKNLTEGVKQSFSGKKVQMTIRRDLRLEAVANVDYVDKDNYTIVMKEPYGISGLNYAINSGKALIHFPYEKLAFADASPTSGDMFGDTILGKMTNDLSLLQKNYNVAMLADDEINGKKTYVIKCTPKDGRNGKNQYWGTPARIYWVNKENFQLMREDRLWGENNEPFFSSSYKEYKTFAYKDSPKVRVKLPSTTKKVFLGNKTPKVETFLESFKTPEDAENKVGEKIALPKYLPDGFKLNEIMVLNFYDTKIIVEKFNDGLNSMFTTYRTKPNMFLVLMAGSFSLPLIQKMSDLSTNAPFNYLGRETKENLIISFGDLYPDDLKAVNESLDLK